MKEEGVYSEIRSALHLCTYNDQRPWRLFWNHERGAAFILPGTETNFAWMMEHHELLATFKEFRHSFEATENEIRAISRELASRLNSRDGKDQF